MPYLVRADGRIIAKNYNLSLGGSGGGEGVEMSMPLGLY